MRTFELVIITPEQLLFSGDARYCRITTDIGSIGFEAMHEPIVAVLKNNTDIHIKDATGTSKTIAVNDGILNFCSNTCSITATSRK